MTHDPYTQLATALDRLPNGFPRTASNVELRILQRIFSPEEAELASQLRGELEAVEVIAERAGIPPKEAQVRLMAMLRRGLVWFERQPGAARFRLAPFIVGIYEAQVELMDHDLAHLVEDYLAQGGAAGIMGLQPALHRVIPAQGTVKSEWVLPYDDVRAVLLANKSFSVHDCICRVERAHVGHPCAFPTHVCLSFSAAERPLRPGDLTQAEALALLEECERVGLVHTVSNVRQGLGYVCNCCGCCCGILRGINEWGLAKSVAYANYYAVIDPAACEGCGTCVTRCQVGAIVEEKGVAVVQKDKCIGCGLCVTGCPHEVARLLPKPEGERVPPPADFAAWERERLANRGLTE